MRKMMIGLAALCAASSANAALVISYDDGVAALNPGLTVIETFEGYLPGAPLLNSFNAFAFNTTSSFAARPGFNSLGNFGAVLGLPTAGFYQINFAPTSAFAFDIGSLDTYNSLEIFFDGAPSQIFTGAAIATGALADGNQFLATSNGRVTYSVNGATPLITGARFGSTNNSFEFDNLATGRLVSVVPEPSTWAMMVLGFGIVGRALRRRRKLSIASFA